MLKDFAIFGKSFTKNEHPQRHKNWLSMCNLSKLLQDNCFFHKTQVIGNLVLSKERESA